MQRRAHHSAVNRISLIEANAHVHTRLSLYLSYRLHFAPHTGAQIENVHVVEMLPNTNESKTPKAATTHSLACLSGVVATKKDEQIGREHIRRVRITR